MCLSVFRTLPGSVGVWGTRVHWRALSQVPFLGCTVADMFCCIYRSK